MDMDDEDFGDRVSDMCDFVAFDLARLCFADVFSTINSAYYHTCLMQNPWGLIPIVKAYFTDEFQRTKPELIECCEQILQIIADKADILEAKSQFLTLLEESPNDTFFNAVLTGMRVVLSRYTCEKDELINQTVHVISLYLDKMQLPHTSIAQENRSSNMNHATFVNRVTRIYNNLLIFYEPIIEEIALSKNTLELYKYRRDLLASHMVQLLGHPLANVELSCSSENKTPERICAEKIVFNLQELLGDGYIFLRFLANRFDGPEETVAHEINDCTVNIFNSEQRTPTLGLGTYYYLVISEMAATATFPIVYTPLYIFSRMLYIMSYLLNFREPLIVRKGLRLASSMITSRNLTDLPSELVENVANLEFATSLEQIMMCAMSVTDRQLAVTIFEKYLFKYEHRARYLFITILIHHLKYNEMVGWLITKYKEMIRLALAADENSLPAYCRDAHLFALLDMFCSLPQEPDVNLIPICGQIMSSLNLITFLLVGDQSNVTSIWHHVPHLQETYFVPLSAAIRRSMEECRISNIRILQHQGGGDTDHVILPHMREEFDNLFATMNALRIMEILLEQVQESINLV